MAINKDTFIYQLKLKNPEALTFVINNYGNLIFKIAYTYLNSKESSEECLNDVLLKAWIYIDDFTYENDKFKNWICSIAKNTAIDILRKEKRHAKDILSDDLEIEDSFDIEHLLISKEKFNIVKDVILKLEEPDKGIMINKFFLGKSLKEISSLYNINLKTVYSRIARIRFILKNNPLLKEE